MYIGQIPTGITMHFWLWTVRIGSYRTLCPLSLHIVDHDKNGRPPLHTLRANIPVHGSGFGRGEIDEICCSLLLHLQGVQFVQEHQSAGNQNDTRGIGTCLERDVVSMQTVKLFMRNRSSISKCPVGGELRNHFGSYQFVKKNKKRNDTL